MSIDDFFETIFIPASVGLFSFDDKGGIEPDSVAERFINSNQGLDVDDPDRKAVFIEPVQILNPVREFIRLLFHVGGIFVRVLLVKLSVKTGFI